MNKPTTNQGFILPTMLFIMLAITVSALALANFAISHFSRTTNSVFATNALLVSEAGAEQTLYQLNQDSNFAGFGSEQELYNDSVSGRATYQTTVSPGSVSNEKIIVATGRLYQPKTAKLKSTRIVRLTVVGTNTGGNHSVYAGSGGLEMEGNATVPTGPIFVNGGVSMSGNARIGSSQIPVALNVANYRCPTSAPFTNYPQLCAASAGQPISTNGNNVRIYGDVCATHQTDGAKMSNSGLQAGCVASPGEMPPHDRSAVISNTPNTLTSAQASCASNETKSWPANVRITGNVTLDGNCNLTVNGNAWVQGRLVIQGNAKVTISNTVTSPVNFVVDGSSGVTLTANGRIIANSSGIAALIVAYHSSASCSPSCSSVTGTDLRNSQALTLITLAGNGNAPGTIFYARWAGVFLDGNGITGGLYGQRVRLRGNGNIVFGTQLSTGSSVWSIKNYQQIFE